MITITENGLLIEMQGSHYGADEIQSLNNELIDVLQAAATIAEDRGMRYYILFDLLTAIAPTYDQLKAIHPYSSYAIKEQKQ